MPSNVVDEATLPSLIEQVAAEYAKNNPTSGEICKKAAKATPGGTTRNVIYFKPFPVVIKSGDGPYLTDVDGHTYLDLCAEYSACAFGHSHPVIKKAMHEAIDDGFSLGGVNRDEGRLAEILVERFPSIEKVRFSNSGTEAVQTCLSLIRAYRGKSTFLFMQGGYHGGLMAFSSEKETNMKSSGTRTMNVPHKVVLSPYNDIESMQALAEEHKEDLAAIVIELMQGSSGCIPVDPAFAKACRAQADALGCVLMFDEVMTSRMSIGGYQSMLGVYPDMTTLGKYFAGGGQNFGAFGGKDEIMKLVEPYQPNGVYHSGTYNNNATTMRAAVAVLEHVWTDEAAQALFAKGEWLRAELNTLSAEMNSLLYVSGVGSLMQVHFTGKPVRNAEDARDGSALLRELFFYDMLKRGIFVARRGAIHPMTVHTREQLQTFIDAVRAFLTERSALTSL